MVDRVAEIRKGIKEGKVIIGTERTVKALKRGKIAKVFLTSNCPEDVSEDIEYYSRLAKAKVVRLKHPNTELGVICKKPFAISVLSFLKGA